MGLLTTACSLLSEGGMMWKQMGCGDVSHPAYVPETSEHSFAKSTGGEISRLPTVQTDNPKVTSEDESSWMLFKRDSVDPGIAAVTGWLEDNCGKSMFGLDNLFVGNFKKGDAVVRGIGVTKDMPKDTFFVCVPRKCWFGPANMPYRYKSLRTKYPEECETVQYPTAIWMADEFRKGKDSYFFPYFQSIPSREDYMEYHPAMARYAGKFAWDKCVAEKGIEHCDDPWEPTGDATTYWDLWYSWLWDCHNKYLTEWNNGRMRPLLKEKGRERLLERPLTKEEVAFAYVITMTRDFEEVGNVPVIDLPNTGPTYNAHQYWYNNQKDTFCLLNEIPMKKGDEINVNYSQYAKNPYIFFHQYAFALGPEVHSPPKAKMCAGLEKDSDIYKLQNGVAKNFAAFSDRYCENYSVEEHKALKDKLAADEKTKSEL